MVDSVFMVVLFLIEGDVIYRDLVYELGAEEFKPVDSTLKAGDY